MRQTKKGNNTTTNTITNRPAIAGRATTATAKRMRNRITKGLGGPALDFAMAIDFDKLAAILG